MTILLCVKCGAKQPLPEHCGRPMKVTELKGEGQKLVCWMGTECGVQNIPEHCEVVMGIAEAEEG